MIRKLLSAEFGDIKVSIHADAAARDFEKVKPQVLLLAFNTLEKAERYYLGLYRFCRIVHSVPHRSLILCRKEDLRAVYELCRKEFFDDYILFWPLSHDGPRLLMSVHLAFRALKIQTTAPSISDLAGQARQFAGLETLLSKGMQEGSQRMAEAEGNLKRAHDDLYGAFDAFSQRLVGGQLSAAVEVRDAAALQREMARLVAEGLRQPLQAVIDSAQPLRQWTNEFGASVGPHLESVRRLNSMVKQIRSVILVVESDEAQLSMFASGLTSEGYEVVMARSGNEGLKQVGKRRPDLILLGIGLPDMSGIEVARRLQASATSVEIPVVIVGSQGERDVVTESASAGARGFLVKPFDWALLSRKISEILQVSGR